MAFLTIRSLREDLISTTLKAPETGMGYQLISTPLNYFSSSVVTSPQRFIVNSEYVFDFENLNNIPLFFNIEDFLDRQSLPFSFDSLSLIANSRYDLSPSASLPAYTYFSKPNDVFIRLSAFNNDRRILPDGSVLSGTYATTLNDIKVVPSGAAAVGRYALPDRLPACHVYRIIPPPKTPIFFGTVTPNYGLCGGGVEVYFPKGCPPGSSCLYETISDK